MQPGLQGVEFKDYPVTIMDKDGKQVRGKSNVHDTKHSHDCREVNLLLERSDCKKIMKGCVRLGSCTKKYLSN